MLILEYLGDSKIVLSLIKFEDVSIELATSVSDLLGNLRNLTIGYEVIPCSSGLARFLGPCW